MIARLKSFQNTIIIGVGFILPERRNIYNLLCPVCLEELSRHVVN